jgi:tetratricopeptide (TPR) repeat protein
MAAANRMRLKRRSLVVQRLTLGVLIGACFASVRQTQAQDSAVDYVNQGMKWDKKGEYDQAIAQYDQAIRLDPAYALAYKNRGLAWYEKQQYDRAIADYDQAIRFDPNYALAYNSRGIAWDEKQDYDRAVADYDQAIRLDPNDARPYYNRGTAWQNKGEYDKAIADYDQAIKLAPSAAAYTNRGFAWSNKKQYDRAVADYDQAIRLDPTVAAYNSLAWLQATCPDARFRDGQKAFENASQAYQLSGGTMVGAIDTLAAAYAENGDFEQARRWQAKAIELSTNNKEKEEYRSRLRLYEQGKPYRQKP